MRYHVLGGVTAVEVSVDYTLQASISGLCVIFSVYCGVEGERGETFCHMVFLREPMESLPVSHNCCSKADEWGKAVANTSVLSFSFSSFIKPFGILQLAILGLTERFIGISTCFIRLHLVPWWLETGYPEAWGIIFISTISVFNSALGTVSIDIRTESVLNPIMVLALPSSCGSKFHNPITDYVKIYFLLLVLSLASFTQTLFPFCSDLYKQDFKIFPF